MDSIKTTVSSGGLITRHSLLLLIGENASLVYKPEVVELVGKVTSASEFVASVKSRRRIYRFLALTVPDRSTITGELGFTRLFLHN